ncbi:MAG TPA: M14 family zinc carboxypeptidase [Solirubrobacteraceae bacterium]|nr:M14 family zinc carboxypeptidase [Solirubrobacteraceae bacterium]
MRSRPILLAGLLAAMMATSAPALAAPNQLPPVKGTLTASAGGADTFTYRAPMSGFVTFRTAASDRSDWDLDLFDAASGRKLAVSHGFGSHEVAQAWVQAGQRIRARATRRAGSARSLRVSAILVDLAPPKSDGVPKLVSVKFRDNEDLQRIDEAGLDLTHHIHHGEADVIVTGDKQFAALDALRLPYEIEIDDMNAHYARSRAADLRYARSQPRSPLPSGREDYRVLQDYQDELKALADRHPDLVRPVVLPKKTFQGREIMGVEIARDVHREDDGRPVYFVHGMHHAREWPSAEAVMEFAHLLVQGNKNDRRIMRLLDRERVVIVPIINVDGFVESREGGAFGIPDPADTTGLGDLQTVEGVVLLGGSFAYRRKNCNGAIPNPNVPCTFQYGVDNNRNYGNGWGGDGAGTDPTTQSYRGTGPFSEPETQAVWEYSRSRQVTGLITMHNVAALVLRPPGLAKEGKAPDEPRMKALGDAMAEAAGYTSQYGWQLYDTSGTTDDYTYAAQGGYGYTVEIGPEDGDFHMPYETGVVKQWTGEYAGNGKGLREALLLGAESAANPVDHSTLRGRAKPGTVLHLRKEFQTATGAKCTYAQGYVNAQTPLDCVAPGAVALFDDEVDSKTVVPDGGAFEWHVNPSSRPFVTGRYIPGEKRVVGETLEFTPELTDNKAAIGAVSESRGSVERQFEFDPAAAPDADELRIRLEWTATPEDYDLKVWKQQNSGTRKPIGVGPSGPGYSGNIPGTFEEVVIPKPTRGTYVIQVIYYAGPANDWKATVEQIEQLPDVWEGTGKTEAYTLTCETADGQVLGSREVTVLRGEVLDLAMPEGCGGRQPRADSSTRLEGAGPAPAPAAAPSRTARRRAAGVRYRVSPRRDRTKPYRFRVRGSVLPAAGLSKPAACAGGKVAVALRKGTRTVGRRTARVTGACRFSTVVTSRRRGRLRLTVRFAGSRALAARAARAGTVRAG